MKNPTGKLEFAYQTIAKLEAEINKKRDINLEITKALTGFIDAYYKGCSKDELNKLRINAEHALRS